MANHPIDEVKVEAIGVGVFDRFTSFDLSEDITAPFEAAFELGDDGSWATLEKVVAPGQRYRVWVNGKPVLEGKVILNSVPGDAQGVSVRFTVRTLIHEAMYASADQRISVKNATLKDIILRAYQGFGVGEEDFIFDPEVSRNMATGQSGHGSTKKKDLKKLTEEDAKVKPPETVYAFVDRHLRRFGLLHWDAPDGRIVVGKPTDDVAPLYRFRMMIGRAGRDNNVLSVERTRDWSELPGVLGVFGIGGKSGFASATVSAAAIDQEVVDAGFYRPVLIVNDAVKTQGQAEKTARRELSARRKQKDAWQVVVDGLSFRSGRGAAGLIPYGVNTTCDIASNTIGRPSGTYFIPKVQMRRTARDGDVTTLQLIRKGLWILEPEDDE